MTPDPRTEVAIKLLCEIHGWTEGDFAYFGDAPLHAKQVALITDALTTEAARVRGETWREAIQLARFGAMELRAMHDDRKADFYGHGPAALQDFADQLEEKAKQADHVNDAVQKAEPVVKKSLTTEIDTLQRYRVTKRGTMMPTHDEADGYWVKWADVKKGANQPTWSTARPTREGHYWYRNKQEHSLAVVDIWFSKGSDQLIQDDTVLADLDGEWCPIARPSEEVG